MTPSTPPTRDVPPPLPAFPELRTSRFVLRQIIATDLPTVFAGLSDPQVIRHYGVSYDSLASTQRQMEQLDPMLVSYDQALNRTVDQILQKQRRGRLRDWWHSPLRRNRKRVIETVVQRVRP